LLDNDYKKLDVAIRQEGAFDSDLQNRFRLLLERSDDLRKMEVIERTVRKRLRESCQAEVAQELPSSHFFVPEVKK
jgi:hypothetical protein